MPVTNLMPWMPLVFLAFGLVFIVLGIRNVTGDRHRRQNWPSYPGRVVGSRLSDGQIQSRVSFVHDGREILFWNRYTTITDPVGRDVEVLVNPDNPNDAVVSGGGLANGIVVGVAFVLFGVLATAVAIFLLR